MSRALASLGLISALFLAAACGGEATPPAGTPTAGTAAPDASAAAAAGTAAAAAGTAAAAAGTAAPTAAPAADPHAGWRDDMTKEQKMAFMKAKVSPEMGKTFQAYDAKKYGDFGCKTCHGPQYKEPKDFLPKLTFKDGKLTAFAEKPEVSKFMAEKVVPQMAALFGKPPYDPKTHQGFGCGGCHTVDMPK
ncbi:MAG: hypothetical protein U0359_00430 [Byssovorax sp.]